jgi:Arc/MetJ-type ribon-helix-helix transcriptional regulator
MEIRLAAEQEALVRELLDAGHFDSPAEAVEAALGLLKDQYELYKIKHAELKQLIAVGIEQADRGQVAPLDMEAVKARCRALSARAVP